MGIQTSKAQGRSTKIFSIITWIQTSRLSIKNPLWDGRSAGHIHTYLVEGNQLILQHKTPIEGAPRALASFQGKVLP